MFKRGPFNFNQFQQQNTSQNVYDAEFKESEPEESKKPKKKINFGKGLKIIPYSGVSVIITNPYLNRQYKKKSFVFPCHSSGSVKSKTLVALWNNQRYQ